ncbi:uncharacterized protein LACBIDRAFT_297749 [Laccaria bicolor S238N-H82]|uniref:Predicted protein n=1 Tax=Laccaria bicolor (strain S238N-H82 / ATCC MYA-4686) TaxID=486041 RepID=B0DAS5_LACBS|nr:uncharacterized protein LACBIDRAFT_297749 [Laccaria bicolor S238N-H82]EDR08263.1 predicted protein [Laccaria bicolor S238N-H82]|eukprot:XP_001881333.1 predicted protein [Laccaria bicolor S238N-H82]
MQTIPQNRLSQPYARSNNFHGPKRQLLGNQAGHAPPSWRTNGPVPVPQGGKGRGAPADSGSKIFLSRLPVDVAEKDVEELFRKTVGPLKESFLIYNSQGRSKGMAVVTFQRPGDAALAREKYDGKIVDGRRNIKIEVIVDGVPHNMGAPRGPPPLPTLLTRLGGAPAAASTLLVATPMAGPSTVTPRAGPVSRLPQHSMKARIAPVVAAAVPPRRIRQKKGPKRLKKRAPMTVDDLDKDMEDYRASAPDVGMGIA